MKHFLISICAIGLLSACAHHKDVRPQANGNHYIQLNVAEVKDGQRELLEQARHYCASIEKHMVVVSENHQYTGTEPEADYKNKRTLAKVAQGVGTGMWILGDGKVDDVGAALTLGSEVAKDAIGAPYQVNLTFRCQ